MIMKKNEIHEELKSLDSSLGTETKKFQYKIPTNYFEELQNEVLVKMQKKDGLKHTISIITRMSNNMLTGVAASVLILLASYFLMQHSADKTDNMNDIQTQHLFTYLQEDLDNIPVEWLYDYMSDENLSFLDDIESIEIESFLEENLQSLEIEDLELYL